MGFAKAVRTDRTLEVVDQLLATAPDAMVIIGADGRIVRVNPQAEKLFGYPQDKLLGQKHDFLITWPHRVRKHKAGNGKRPKVRLFGYGLEGVAHRPDGGQFPIAVNLGLLDVRTDTLISHAIQKTQREHGEDLDLRAIVDASDDAIIGTDFDGTIVSWNKGAEKITGYSAEEVLGRPVTVLTPPSYLDEFSRNIRRLQRGEHIEPFETTRIHKDGHPVDVSVTISPVRNRSGLVVGASVVARDITEHKEAQSALLGLQAIVDASDDAIIGGTLDGTIVSWNKGAEKMYGYSAEEVVGQKVSVLIPPGHLNEVPEIMVRLQRGEHIEKYQAIRMHKDGHPIDVSMTISPVKSRTGIVVGASAVARDITENREVQNALLDLRAIVEASDDGIIGIDLNSTIVSWNKGAERIYGYRADEVLGRPSSLLVPLGQSNLHKEILIRLRGGERTVRFEATRIHKNGYQIDVAVTVSPVTGRRGIVVGASVVTRDITLERQAHEALRLSEERFRVALKNSPVVVFSQDLQLRYTWINAPRLLPSEGDLLGRTDAEVFGAEDGARLTAIKNEVLRTGIGSHTEVTITFAGLKHYFDLVVEPLRDSTEKLLGLLSSAIETTASKEMIIRLQEALNQVQLLSGLLPICASCKRIRDEHEAWQPLEVYIQGHSEAKFSHGICPDCLRKLYPEQYQK